MNNTMQNDGVYKCLLCNLHIRVKSKSRHGGYYYPKAIKKCPHCKGEIEKIDTWDYNDFEHSLWISVTKNKIKLSLKFPVVKCTT